MSTELRTRSQAAQLYVQALSSAWRSNTRIYDPTVWLTQEPELEEKMLRDADIAHAIGYRKHLIAGRQWQLQAQAKGSPRSDLAVMIGTQLLGKLKHFTSARMNLARAFLSGARFAQIHGTTQIATLGDGRPRYWWFPVRLEDLDKRSFQIVPDRKDDKLTAHWQKWDVAAGQWKDQDGADALMTIRHVYQDDQASLGYGRGLREALAWWWTAKANVFAESLQAVERFAQGIIHAKVDGARDAETGLPNAELIRQWTEVLKDLRSRHVLVSDTNDSIELIQASGTGWQLLKEIRDELKSTIFTLILGANLTTGADKGGSYALAEVQENSTESLVQFDRETLEETLTDDLLGAIWSKNWGNLLELGVAQERPRFNITQEKKTDPKVRADVANVLHTMGVSLALEDVLEQTGFRKPQEGEETIEGASQVVPGAGFGDGFGAGIPGFGDKAAE